MNLPIDNSLKKNYNKTKKFGNYELTIRNQPPRKCQFQGGTRIE
nr:MAG TPA: hypothetical protein [Caudoviricetes sp.]